MKKLLLLFPVLFLLLPSCKKEDSPPPTFWSPLPSGTAQTLTDIHFLDENIGIACGEFGAMIKTVDAGNAWEVLDIGVNHSFLSAFMLNSNEFFTSRIGLFKTEDGGTTFNELGETSSFGASIFDIHFYSSDVGLICKGGNIHKTEDGGDTWQNVYPGFGYASLFAATAGSTIYLAGGQTFDAVNQGELHKSTDGGDTWEQLDLPTEIAGSQITAIDFLDENIGYMATFNRRIYRTFDGGASWIGTGQLNGDVITDMVMLDSENVYLITGDKIYQTNSGGAAWGTEYLERSPGQLTAIDATPSGKLFVVGVDGVVLGRDE